MVDLAIAMNRTFEFTCPKCGSHNVNIAWDNRDNWFVVTCDTCGFERRHTYPELMHRLHGQWKVRIKPLEKHDDQPKEVVKQRVVRSNSRFVPNSAPWIMR